MCKYMSAIWESGEGQVPQRLHFNAQILEKEGEAKIGISSLFIARIVLLNAFIISTNVTLIATIVFFFVVWILHSHTYRQRGGNEWQGIISLVRKFITDGGVVLLEAYFTLILNGNFLLFLYKRLNVF